MRSPELHIAHKPFISSRPVSGFLIPYSSFLIICALLLGGQMLQAQTTWDGSTDSNWNTPDNWSAGVPDADDDVTIPDVTNDPVIMGGTAAVANSVSVNTSASLTINATGSLTINGSSLHGGITVGLYNEGTVANSGDIILGSTASVGQRGLWNLATFSNNTGGEISIDRSTFFGLFNQTGTFTNAAKITIGAVAMGIQGLRNQATFNNNSGGEISIDRSASVGLYNASATFTNAAKITIGATASIGVYGIWNFSTFNNNTSGEISIDRSSDIGLNNSGTFTNAAKITIGATASIGDYGILNQGTFNNSASGGSGEISIDRSSTYGLHNLSGTFTNAAKITIGATASVGPFGIWNGATFNNSASGGTGEISIDRSSLIGLSNEFGTFTNTAKITIGAVASVGSYGMTNQATFNNNSGGEISIDRSSLRGLWNFGGTFTNAAKITIGAVASAGSDGIKNEATFNNSASGGTGEISIDRSSGIGLSNASGTFTNAAKITIGAVASVGSYGMTNQATFNNSASDGSGEISIDRSSLFGLWNFTGTFTNAAKITIGAVASVGSDGILNSATFNNSPCTALVRIASDAIVNNLGTFTNAGSIIENASENSSITTNTGVVQNLNGGTFSTGGTAAITTTGDIWTGCTSTDWATATNWLDQSVPTATDDVTISNVTNDAVIMGGTAALANSVSVNTSASLTINDMGSLTINGFSVHSGTTGFYNRGTVTNSGDIILGSTGSVGYYGIWNLGTFNNSASGGSGAIHIDRANYGIFNSSGTFTNQATITIGAVASVGDYGIRNNATFNNSPCAALINIVSNSFISNIGTFTNAGSIIENASGNSNITTNTGVIQNLNGGTFTTGGTAAITTTGDIWTGCISTDWATASNWLDGSVPTATNDATIPNVTNDPVIMAGTAAIAKSVSVNTSASLTIDDMGSLTINGSSLHGSFTAGLYNEGTVANNGDIILGSTGSVGHFGLWNLATFNNNPALGGSGEISIDRSSTYGLFNNLGTFTNAAKITIGAVAGVGQYGIFNRATFNNSASGGSGEVSIDRSSNTGLYNDSGTFTNAAKITIGAVASVGQLGILNFATFHNNVCALLSMFAPLSNNNSFTNSGLFTLNTAGAHTNFALTNNGILSYPQGNALPSVTNNEIIIAPTTVNACKTISPAFSLGSPVDFSIVGVFTDAGATMSAGTYVVGTNTFTASPVLAEGTHNLFVKIEDIGGGCTRILPWQLTTQNCCDAPVASCQSASVVLVGNSATLSVAQVDNGSTAECGLQSSTVSPNTFNCGHVGTPQTVTLTVTAINGDSDDCQATVTVLDQTAPSITCPGNIAKNTDADQCSAVTTYAVTASDNCSYMLTCTAGLASGAQFPKGLTTVEWKVTDTGGSMTTCAFTVTVTDAQLPSITCPANIVRYTDPGSCATAVTYADPAFSDNCPNAALSKESGPASGASLGKGAYDAIWKATQEGGGLVTRCTLNITVIDNILPAITCPATQTRNTDAGQCAALVTHNNPTATDNCSPAPTATHVSGGTGTVQGASTSTATFQKGITTVQWKAVDGVGLTKTCTFRVIVNDLEAPTLTCPTPAPVNAAPGLCTAAVTYANPAFADNCAPTSGTSTRVSGPTSGANFPVGNTNVTFQATDAAGNTKRCTMTVTVVDNQLPTITCPPPVAVNSSGNPCTATVFYNNPTATDNCAGALAPFLLSGVASGSSFPAGVTTNTWRAIAPGGQSADCSFDVTVTCGASRGGDAENREAKSEGAANAPSPSHLLTFSLSPNPAAQEAWLDLSALEGLPCAVYLLDVRGALVQQHPVAQTTAAGLFRLDLDGLPTGLYLVQVQVPGQKARVLKLVVERG